MIGSLDLKENPMAIPEYLEKHFKEKEKMAKERKMMGTTTDDMKDKIQEFEDRASIGAQTVSIS